MLLAFILHPPLDPGIYWCDLFLMSSPADKEREVLSAETYLYLYKETSSNKVYYCIKGAEEKQYLDDIEFPKDEKFISKKNNLIKYENKDVIRNILEITSNRRHTKRHSSGTIYVLAAEVEETKVNVASFYMGGIREGTFKLSEDGSLKEIKGSFYSISRIINSMKDKTCPYPFVTLSTKTTYEQLIKWQKDYANKKKEPSEWHKQMLWKCSKKRNYVLGNNCADEALRVLRDGCGIFPKTTTVTKILQSICATSLCLSTCACGSLCVCYGLTAPTFPLVVNTPKQVFYALQQWASHTQEKNSVNFLDYIFGKATASTKLQSLQTDEFKEVKVHEPQQQIMTDAPKVLATSVRFLNSPSSAPKADKKLDGAPQEIMIDKPTTVLAMRV